MDSKQMAEQVNEYVVDFRRDMHRHPEPSFKEIRTTARIAAALDAIGIPYHKFEPTGLIGTIKGGKPGKTVALRADIDALSIIEKSSVEFASENVGYMHACAHDTHAAMLLGAAKALYQIRDELPGTVKVLFQPAEEIAEGAKMVVTQGALDGVDMIFGQHMFGQVPVGLIEIGEDVSMSAADKFKITVKGVAAHGAMPETGKDATVAAAAIVMNLQSIVSRELSPLEPVVVTVGTLHSGSRWNIVSGSAEMEGTVRSFSKKAHMELPGIIERIAKKTAEAYRCEIRLDYSVLTEGVFNDPQASNYARAAALKAAPTPDMVLTMPKRMVAEDFSEYTTHVKGGFVILGGGGEHPQHSDYFYIDEKALKTGVTWYIQVAYDYLVGNAV